MTRRMREMIDAIHALWRIDPTLMPSQRIEAMHLMHVRPGTCRCGHPRSDHRARVTTLTSYHPVYARVEWFSRRCLDHCEFRCRRYVPHWAVLLGLREPAQRPPEWDGKGQRWIWEPPSGGSQT